MWKDVNYWAVFEEGPDGHSTDRELFRGSMTACRKWEKKHGGIVSKVILEWID